MVRRVPGIAASEGRPDVNVCLTIFNCRSRRVLTAAVWGRYAPCRRYTQGGWRRRGRRPGAGWARITERSWTGGLDAGSAA
jgi:hypothetical protein